jgi:hypothetical protein
MEEVLDSWKRGRRHRVGYNMQDSLFGLAWNAQAFPDCYLAGLIVVENKVGERTADVDADPCCHG